MHPQLVQTFYQVAFLFKIHWGEHEIAIYGLIYSVGSIDDL